MKLILERLGPTAALFFIMLPVAAHHSAAMYDQQQDVRLEGIVTQFDWADPHAYIRVETENEGSESIVWLIEGRPPSAMSKLGWSRDSLAIGERVTVAANPGRNVNRKIALGLTVMKEDGTLLNILRPGAEGASGTSSTTFVADEISGNWETRTTPEVLLPYRQPEISWSLTDKGLAALESYEEISMSPSNDCVSELPPRTMNFPAIKRIEIGEQVTMIRLDDDTRTIHMNLNSHEGASYTTQGHSIGWWEGDVLVIDTTHYAEHRTGNAPGLPSGRQRHLIERFELTADQSGLTYTFWNEDPEYLLEPMIGTLDLTYRPDLPFVNVPCDIETARRYRE
jgi:hypothetical protein